MSGNPFWFELNQNPKGRKTCDCVVRSISIATCQPWDVVLRGLTEVAIQTGYMVNDPKCYGKYLEERGWVQCPRIKRGRKYLTGKEFCAITNMPRFILAHIGAHHMVCIVDNSIVDYWDCTDQRVGIYWIKQDQGLSGTMEYGA